MFYGIKKDVREALHLLQRKVCCYDMLFRPEQAPHICDCKYGYNPLDKHASSEQTGCPELRTVVALLDKMTEEEYYSILARR